MRTNYGKRISAKTAFSMAELLIALTVLGVIAAVMMGIVKSSSQVGKSMVILSKKTLNNLENAMNNIVVTHVAADDFTKLKDDYGYFSIKDEDSTSRMTGLFKKYLLIIDKEVDTSKEYFSNNIIDYNGSSLGINLKDTYSNFFYMYNGTLVGMRLYGSCDAEEENAITPDSKEIYKVNNICGSIFYDVNGRAKPNKLGLDQYIIPFSKDGIRYISE